MGNVGPDECHFLPPGGCGWDCRLPLAPVAPGRGRLTHLCALTVSWTRGHDDLLLVNFLTSLVTWHSSQSCPTLYFLSKLFSVHKTLAEGATFLSGLSARLSNFSSTVGHFVYGGPRSRARLAPTNYSSSQFTTRTSKRQSPAAVVVASRSLKKHQAESWIKGMGMRGQGGLNVKWGFSNVCISIVMKYKILHKKLVLYYYTFSV